MDFIIEVRHATTGDLLGQATIYDSFTGTYAVWTLETLLKDVGFRHPDVPYVHNVPVIKHLDAKILTAIEQAARLHVNPLDMSVWHERSDPRHWCGTTHCRSGWAEVIALRETGTFLGINAEINGHLIYAVSRPRRALPDFFASTSDALDSLRRDAAADPLPASANEKEV